MYLHCACPNTEHRLDDEKDIALATRLTKYLGSISEARIICLFHCSYVEMLYAVSMRLLTVIDYDNITDGLAPTWIECIGLRQDGESHLALR